MPSLIRATPCGCVGFHICLDESQRPGGSRYLTEHLLGGVGRSDACARHRIRGSRNTKYLAHHHDGKLLLVLFDKLIVHLLSREKMLTTFFNISRSCCTRSSSRLRRRFSSSKGV